MKLIVLSVSQSGVLNFSGGTAGTSAGTVGGTVLWGGCGGGASGGSGGSGGFVNMDGKLTSRSSGGIGKF